VIHIVLHESSLQEEFVNNSVFTLTHLRNKDTATIQMLIKWLNETFKLDSIICNSVETYPVLEAASELKIPIISLLHEFSEYTRPRGKITNTIIHSDKVIVPARIIAESAFKEMSDYFGIKNKTNNIVVLPQGKLPFIPESNGTNFTVDELRKKFNIDEKQHKVVVGAGYVQTRKGVDLFIDAAFKIKQDSPVDCKFIWVGGGFEPEYDIGCSVWLQSQLDEFGLTDDFFFLSHQKSLDDIFALADAYLLTSRLDPFPNVMIDALQADLPVVCFDRTTGCAEFLLENKSVSAVVPFLDTAMMAEKTIAFLVDNKSKNNTHKNINSALVKEKLCFQSYVTSLLNIIEESKQLITKRTQIENVIIDSELFNTRFYGQTGDSQLAIEYYVKTSLNGIHSSSPLPGFSLGKWFESTQPESVYVVPLYEAIRSGKDLETHECQMITGGLSSISKKKIAVHLHLYYVDLAEDFATYFSCLPVGFDLYITVCESGIQDKVKDVFSVSGANIIDVIEVENIGRDVAPFFISLKDKIYQKGYDIIGHFHSKKSNDVDQGTGDRWRKYLLSNLIGSIPAVNEIFQSFESNSVGLVFAEDSHNVDFGKNKPFSDKLCNAMFIDKLESATLFPLGTMFWAKPEALSPLFELNMKEFLQPEPLPYDGSYMHAIERLISHVVTNTGYKIVSVYTQNTKW
jgi:glycosyltransferase involved in cell wall biosynthesis